MQSTDFRSLLASIQSYVREELIPMEPLLLGQDWLTIQTLLDARRAEVKKMGLWAPQVDPEFGGLGLNLKEFAQVMEVLGQTPYGVYVFNSQAPDAGNMEILAEFGTAAQQKQFLEPLAAGQIRSCFAMTEPEFAGSNPVFMGTVARKEGDVYVLNGHKWFTTGADGAAFAIVMCLTAPEATNPYEKASLLIVPTESEGFEFVRNISMFGDAGGGWASHAELRFKDCPVPAAQLLGQEGAGFAIAQTRLGPGRIHHCMRWMGICERAFDLMCRRAVRRTLAPGQALAQKQTIQNWIAESRASINAAKLLIMDAAHKIDAVGVKAARVDISVIKFFCAQVLQEVLDRAVQVHGAMGLTDDTPLAFWYAHERGARIYDGADEVHKSRVARHILKKYQDHV